MAIFNSYVKFITVNPYMGEATRPTKKNGLPGADEDLEPVGLPRLVNVVDQPGDLPDFWDNDYIIKNCLVNSGELQFL
jgi:hypothetical protein